MKLYFVLLCFICFMAATASPIFAAITVSFSGTPPSIDQAQEFEINVSLSCSSCTSDSYLRSVFYPSGTSYFGYTQNNAGNWINAPGGNCTEYFKILSSEISPEGTWSGKLKVKPDISSPSYSGPGDYLFKVGRYTTSCSTAWSPETTITITGPTPTLTPTPTPTLPPSPVPTSTPLPSPSPTPRPPTATPIPTKESTKTPVSTTTIQATLTAGVLGEMITATPAVGLNETTQRSWKPLIISLLFISAGLALLALVLVWQKRQTLTPPTP